MPRATRCSVCADAPNVQLELLEPGSALTHALVLATYGGEVLLVHNSWRLH